MIHTTDYQKALKAYEHDLYDIKRKSAEDELDLMRSLRDWQMDYANAWTRPQIPDSAFDATITWRDILMALWG